MSWKTNLMRFASKAGAKLKAKSPTIMVVGGVAGLVVAGILACKETHDELDNIINDHKEKVQAIKDIRDGVVVLDSISTEEYAEKKYKKHLFHIYLSTICKLAKAYAPAFLLATASILSIFFGYGTLKKWHLQALGQAAAWKKALDEYRGRWQQIVGKEQEEKVYYNEDVEVVNAKVKDKDGKEKDELRESVFGKGAKLPYCYIASRETIKTDWWEDDERQMTRKIESFLTQPANAIFDERGECTIVDIMRPAWERDYLKKYPEIRSGGWWRENPYAAALPAVHPIEAHVNRISNPGEPLVLSVTFNAQGDIYAAMELAKREERDTKARFRNRAKIKPAAAFS